MTGWCVRWTTAAWELVDDETRARLEVWVEAAGEGRAAWDSVDGLRHDGLFYGQLVPGGVVVVCGPDGVKLLVGGVTIGRIVDAADQERRTATVKWLRSLRPVELGELLAEAALCSGWRAVDDEGGDVPSDEFDSDQEWAEAVEALYLDAYHGRYAASVRSDRWWVHAPDRHVSAAASLRATQLGGELAGGRWTGLADGPYAALQKAEAVATALGWRLPWAVNVSTTTGSSR